jgi:hypothetical protein
VRAVRIQVERRIVHTAELVVENEHEIGEAALEAESSGVGVVDTQISVDVLHDTIEEVGMKYFIYEPDPEGGPGYTLWSECTDPTEAVDHARDLNGYATDETGKYLADYRK